MSFDHGEMDADELLTRIDNNHPKCTQAELWELAAGYVQWCHEQDVDWMDVFEFIRWDGGNT